MSKTMFAVAAFAAAFAAGAADLITAREATNIAESVVVTSGVGAARMLPKYLHYAEFDDCYATDAEAYYERMEGIRDQGPGTRAGVGGCSVLRRGNVVGRNYDLKLDEAAEFVVRVSPFGSRHGSVGIATLGTNLTERMVTSGKHTDLYRVLPGRTVDGINDAGLVAEVNVIPYDPASSPTQGVTRTLHAFGVVRYALDNFGSAREAAEYIAAHYYIPEGSEYAYHWSFSDAEGSWIVEDGRCAKATQGQVMSMSMTNFRIWWITRFIDPETGMIDRAALAAEDPYGTGVERFEAMYGADDVAAALEKVAYTKTYLAVTEPRRISEFAEVGVARVDESATLSNVAAQVIAAWPGKEEARKAGVWWQTVHSSIYDIEKRTLAVAVQENFSKRYVFHADETNERFRKVDAKANKAANPTSGNLASLTSDGDLADSGKKPDDFLPSSNPKSVSGTINWEADDTIHISTGIHIPTWDSIETFNYENLPSYIGSGRWNPTYNPFVREFDLPQPYVPYATDPTFSNAVNDVYGAAWTNALTDTASPNYEVFSNAVIAVQIDTNILAAVSWIASSTNAVAQICELYAALESIGITPAQGGMTLGGLLAAIVALLVWLKKNALTDGLTNGEPSDTKLHKFFQNTNSLLTGTIDGQTKATASDATSDAIELPDGGVVSATMNAQSTSLTITFGAARQANGLRFCELYVTNTDTASDKTIASISGKVYSDVSLSNLPNLEKGATYYFTFAEFKVENGVSHWKVSKQKLDAMGGDIPTPTAA